MGIISGWKKKKELREAEVEYELNQYKVANRLLEEARSTPIADPDESEWIQSGVDFRMSASDHSTMLEQAFKFYHNNTHARAIIRTLVKFTLGKGPNIIPEDDNQKVKDVWKKFVKENKFNHREKEIATRLFRDGEVFNRIFKSKTDDGLVRLRFVRASSISQPAEKQKDPTTSFGIKTNPEDIEDVIEYYRVKEDGTEAEIIKAEDVIHLKILADSDQKRGVSILRIAAKKIAQYEDWLEGRIKLNKVRSAIALVKQIQGSSGKIKSIREDSLSDRLNESRKKLKAFEHGSIITTSDKVNYSLLSPNINAQDARDDGRAILLCIAAAVGFPEMILTADYSNANMASTQIAQNPFIREIEDWQDYFSTFYKQLFEVVIQNAIDYGPLPKSTSTDCTVEFPPIVLAELKELAQAYEILHKYKVLSKKTWASRMGLNFDLEQAYQESEEEEEMPVMFPPNNSPTGQLPAGAGRFNLPVAPVNQYMSELEEAIEKDDMESVRRLIKRIKEIEKEYEQETL